MQTLIVIPTYNESGNITTLIEQIFSVVPSVHLLIVDDHSPDGTGEIVEGLRSRFPQLHIIHREGKLGLGSAYIRGFHYAIKNGFDLVFEMDADFSHDPTYLPAFLQLGVPPTMADLVIGSRYIHGGSTPNWSALRRFVSGGGNRFARLMLRIPIKDCTSGFRCYRTSALAQLHIDLVRSQGYAFQVEMAYAMWKSGFRVRETPIVFVDRRVGQSKMSRKIFVEAFVWVMRTFFRGSPVSVAPSDAVTSDASVAWSSNFDDPEATAPRLRVSPPRQFP